MKNLYKFSLLIILVFTLTYSIFAQTQNAQQIFEEGVRLAQNNQIEEALKLFKKSAELAPTQPAPLIAVGQALVILKRPQEAIEPYRKAINLMPENAQAHAGLCRALSYVNKTDEAIKECREALKFDGNSLEANTNLILAYQIAKRPQAEILALTEKALQKFPDDINLLNVAAAAYAESGNDLQALEIYRRLVEMQPQVILYQMRLAELNLNRENDAEAIAAARKAIELRPNDAAGHFFLGRIYFALGQHNEAKEAFRKAAEISPEMLNAWYFLSLSETRSGNTDEGIIAMKKAYELSPEDFVINKELGSKLTSAGKYKEAVVYLKKALSLKPQDFEVKVNLGLALFESAQHEEGIRILMEANRMRPDNSASKMFLSVSRARQEDFARLEEIRQAADKEPRNLNLQMRIIETLGYAGRIDEAEPYIQKVLRMNSKNIEVYQTIGIVYSTARKYDKASEIFRKSMEIKENPGAYLNLAGIYTKEGKINEAIAAYDKVLELKSDVPNVMKIYADLLRDNGKYREALAMYKRSLAMLPTNAPALYNAGMLSVKFGEIGVARQYLETLKPIDGELAKTLERFIRFKDR